MLFSLFVAIGSFGLGYFLGDLRGYARGCKNVEDLVSGWRESSLSPPPPPEQSLEDVLERNQPGDPRAL